MSYQMYNVTMHVPFEGNPEKQGGFRLSFACGFDTVIPIELVDANVQGKIDRCSCPGCGAPCNVVSVVYRELAD